MSKYKLKADTRTNKYSKSLYTCTHQQKQRQAFVQIHTQTHIYNSIVNVFSLQPALPEMLLPSGPQARPSTLITGRQDSVLY